MATKTFPLLYSDFESNVIGIINGANLPNEVKRDILEYRILPLLNNQIKIDHDKAQKVYEMERQREQTEKVEGEVE